MAALSPERRTLRARKMAAVSHGTDTTDIDRQIREARAREYIRELVDPNGWPPLSAEARAELAALLAPSTSDAAP